MTETGEQHWGSLGEPEQQAAKLLHVVDTPVATMRHAFYQPGATVPNYSFGCDTLVYGVGGPCIQHHDGARLVRRRLMFYPKGYEHKLEFLGPAHILAIELSPRDSDRNGFSGLSAATPLPATLYTPVWRVMLEAADGEPPERVGLTISELLGMMADFADRSAPACVIDTIDRSTPSGARSPAPGRSPPGPGSVRNISAVPSGRRPAPRSSNMRCCCGSTMPAACLWATGLPIADIAARTGFADQSHLTRALTADTARTPRRLRSSAPCSEFAREMAHLFSSQDLPRRDVIAPLYPDRLRAAGGLPAPRC